MTKKEPEFTVNGNSTIRVEGYLVWEVRHKNGNLMVACHGPASALGAATIARELNASTQCSPLDAVHR